MGLFGKDPELVARQTSERSIEAERALAEAVATLALTRTAIAQAEATLAAARGTEEALKKSGDADRRSAAAAQRKTAESELREVQHALDSAERAIPRLEANLVKAQTEAQRAKATLEKTVAERAERAARDLALAEANRVKEAERAARELQMSEMRRAAERAAAEERLENEAERARIEAAVHANEAARQGGTSSRSSVSIGEEQPEARAPRFRRTPPEATETPSRPVSSDFFERSIAAAAVGTGWFDAEAIPDPSPNFIYGLLATAWAEKNQLVRIDFMLAAELASALRDNTSYTESQTLFQTLTDRTINSPNRTPRLKKRLIDAVNGLPDGDEPRPLFDRIVSERLGYPVKLHPTNELIEQIYRASFGWGPIEPYMHDPTVTEVMVTRYDGIFIERTIPGQGSELVEESARFESPTVYQRFLERMVEQAGKVLNFEESTSDFTLPDGSRVNVAIAPTAVRAPALTIRRKREKFYTLDELEGLGSFTPEMRSYFQDVNLAGGNIITYGPTGSGKTTLLAALIDDKLPERRLVIVEDTAEINVDLKRHPNSVFMLTNEHRSMRDLVRNALRMRPDHLIVGETRDQTAYDLIQAFNSGQTGSISTVHARDPESALVRLTNLVRESESAPTEEPARRMVAEAIHLLINAARLADGTRRIVSVDEVVELGEGFEFRTQNVFHLQVEGKDPVGRIRVRFVANPSYVMAPALASLFRAAGIDPNKWTGESAQREGRSVEAEVYE